MRVVLAILIAYVAFGASLSCFLKLEDTFQSIEIDPLTLTALFATFLVPSLLIIAGGVITAPKAGLRSHILDSVRGNLMLVPGQWAGTAFIGLVVCLLAMLASAAIHVLSPASFATEENWRDITVMEAIKLAAVSLAMVVLGWVGLLNLLAWICLRIFGMARRNLALAAAIVLAESLYWGLIAILIIYLDYPFDLAMMADGFIWSSVTIMGAWLYVTRTLEHGVLALMWIPILTLALRPLWTHLGI
ncbi:hypothetical protein [Microvirga guangxiensis]|uniref:Uncharacterized protein n=1 Tax=Microvirga guangxiensis TaxID=549386 RepID=A0A1G5GGW1_9HYPH|nr:hypothetical protein [Microvirga guangxiensis]SCY50734.1 hypothetical protein SAMN02927923_01506 [Microvirga guangxiensis]